VADLELIIDELKNEIVFKDQDYKEIREDLELLKEENLELSKLFKEEKIKRQSLEANKTKYTYLKELMENADSIQDQSFFDNKRNQNS